MLRGTGSGTVVALSLTLVLDMSQVQNMNSFSATAGGSRAFTEHLLLKPGTTMKQCVLSSLPFP